MLVKGFNNYGGSNVEPIHTTMLAQQVQTQNTMEEIVGLKIMWNWLTSYILSRCKTYYQ